MIRARKIAWAWAPPLVLAALLGWSAPPWPDDWDGLGFLESIDHFDMDRFAPHPPGYPVYVALLRLAAVVFRDPMHTAIAVSVASGIVVFVCARSVTAQWGELAASLIAAAVVGSPLAWRAFTAVGSEAPALALVAIAYWAIRGRRLTFAAVALGLALGVRLSWAPLLLAMPMLITSRARPRAFLVMTLSVLSWLVPLLAIVGPRHLVEIYGVHFAGHAQRWGGTALADPLPIGRLALFARDIFVDGIGVDSDVVGVALAVVLVLVIAVIVQGRGLSRTGTLAAIGAPYALWIFVGQNLRDQPRHALPLVVATIAVVGVGAARAQTLKLALPLLGLMLTRTIMDGYDRRTTPPAGEQLVTYLRSHPRDVVFGSASVRFFARTNIAYCAFPAETRGDVEIALTRMAHLPERVLVTSEVSDMDTAPIVVEFCRPARIDRKRACLALHVLD